MSTVRWTGSDLPQPMSLPEVPEEYAQRRAQETGRPYLVTMMGHVLLDEPHNRALAVRDLGGVAGTYLPK